MTATKKKVKKVMSTQEAFEIVYDLANENALDPKTCDRELRKEAKRQQEALAVASDFILNNIVD